MGDSGGSNSRALPPTGNSMRQLRRGQHSSAPHGDDRRHEDAGTAISQLLDFYDTDYLGQYNPEAAGDCWSLAYSGSRSDAERVEMPHAELSIHVRDGEASERLSGIRRVRVRPRTDVSRPERGGSTRVRDKVWKLTSTLGPRVWGTINDQRRDHSLPAFRRKLFSMGR